MTNNVSFPGLNLEFTINRVAFCIFSKEIYWYAIIILTGFLLSLLLVYFSAQKRGVNKDNVFDVAFYGLISGIVCARIYYVIFDISCLDGNILNIVKVWEGGLAIYGGIIGAVICTIIYCRYKKINTFKMFDVCAPGLLLGQAIGRWGNFVNCEVYGKEAHNFLRMSINSGTCVHPLFLYESLWNILGLIIVLIFRDRKHKDGQVFFFYTLWYGIGRLFLEGMRQPEYILYVIDGVLGISQVVAFLCIVISVCGLIILEKNTEKIDKR